MLIYLSIIILKQKVAMNSLKLSDENLIDLYYK